MLYHINKSILVSLLFEHSEEVIFRDSRLITLFDNQDSSRDFVYFFFNLNIINDCLYRNVSAMFTYKYTLFCKSNSRYLLLITTLYNANQSPQRQISIRVFFFTYMNLSVNVRICFYNHTEVNIKTVRRK